MPLYHHKLIEEYNSDSYYNSGFAMPAGAVFYASLNGKTPGTAQTGQTLTNSGTVTYQSVDGIACAYFGGQSYLSFNASNFSYGQDFSVSFWVNSNITDKQRAAFSYGSNQANKAFAVMMYTDGKVKTIGTNDGNNQWTSQGNLIAANEWNHIVVVNHVTYEDIYVNDVKVGTFNYTRDVTNSGYGYIGCLITDQLWNMIGYVSSIRFYNRALTQAQIDRLFGEYTRYQYSSQGFDDYGHSVRYDSAVDAGCNIFPIPQSGLLCSAIPQRSWTAGQAIASWGDFSQSNTSRQPQIATINGITGIKARSGDELYCNATAATGDLTFAVKFYVGDTSTVNMGCLKFNTWYGAIMGFEDVDGDKCFLLSKQGVSYVGVPVLLSTLGAGIHTAVITYKQSDGETKFYFDKALYDTKTYNIDFSYSSDYYYAQSNTSDNLILGLAAYNRVLSAEEISGFMW